ncbi:MAG: hypothetical protein WCR72_19190, partial [Bacteroidota bacterium]
INSGNGTDALTVTWYATGTQTVSVVYTNENGCVAAAPSVYSIIVQPLPVPALAGPASVCENSVGNIYTTNPGMTFYNWIVSPGGTVTLGGGTTNSTVTVQWITPGAQSVSVNYTDANGCVAATASQYPVTVHALPVPTISGLSATCVNTINNIYATEAGKTGYTWTVSAGGTISAGAGTNAITVTWNTTGAKTVSVNYTDAFSCSAATPTVHNVTVNPLPVPVITGAPEACINSNGNIYSTDAGMSAYAWTISAGGIINSGAGTSAISVTWNTAGLQSVTATYTNTNGCLAATPSIKNITVNPLPVPTMAGPTFVCATSTGNVYLTESGKTGYNWFVPGGTITAGLGSASITVTWNTPGIHGVTVTYTDAKGCTGTSNAYSVTVNELPQPVITGSVTHCESVPGNVYSTTAGMTNYNWSISPGGTISSGQGTNTILVKWNAQGANTLSVTYTDVNACAAPVPGLLAVDVHPYPVSNAGIDDYICSDVPNFKFNTSSGLYYNLANIHWSFYGVSYTSGGSLDDVTLLHPTFTPAGTDLTQVNRVVVFVLTLEGTGSCAGMYARDTVLLRIDPIPVANAGPNGEICGQRPYQLNASTALYQSSIVWSTNGDGAFNNKFIPNPSYTPGPLDVGNIVQLTMDLAGCKNLPNSSSMWLTVHPDPSATISGTTAICEGTSTQVSVALTGTPPWNFTYTDGLVPVTVTNVMSSPYQFMLTPPSNIVLWLSAADDNF